MRFVDVPPASHEAAHVAGAGSEQLVLCTRAPLTQDAARSTARVYAGYFCGFSRRLPGVIRRAATG
jgi:hypothetical protein